jgi:hypothetical protein
MEKEIIKKEINDFKIKHGGSYQEYYIGITNDLDRRLVENSSILLEHISNGRYTKGYPLYTSECDSNEDCVEIERFFQDLGMLKFNPRSFGREDSVFIYCFKTNAENRKMILEKEEYFADTEMITTINNFKEFLKKI